MLKVGSKAPDFELFDTDGKLVRLKDLKGKKVILYFYPRDDTPGCTLEACSFRDDSLKYKKKSIVVLGVSKDDLKSHEKFRTKYSLNFPLLSDPGLEIAKKYFAYGKGFMGHMGVIRSTFVIDEQGLIQKAMYKVKVDGHSKELLELL